MQKPKLIPNLYGGRSVPKVLQSQDSSENVLLRPQKPYQLTPSFATSCIQNMQHLRGKQTCFLRLGAFLPLGLTCLMCNIKPPCAISPVFSRCKGARNGRENFQNTQQRLTLDGNPPQKPSPILPHPCFQNASCSLQWHNTAQHSTVCDHGMSCMPEHPS